MMTASPVAIPGDRLASAPRVNRSLTAGIEKQFLIWMAQRTPHWVTSDQLTLLGLAAQMAAGALYVVSHSNRYALIGVAVCIGLNWLGDSMDGTLARVRNQLRPRYGFYADHMVDVLGATVLMCGLGCSGFVHWPVAIAMLIGFLLLSAESYLATYTLSCFKMSQGWFGPTEIRILLIVTSLELLRSPYATVLGRRFLLFDIGGVIAAALMAVMVVVTTLRHTVELYRQEPLS